PDPPPVPGGPWPASPAGAGRPVQPAPTSVEPVPAIVGPHESGAVCGGSRPGPRPSRPRCAAQFVAEPDAARARRRRRSPARPGPVPSPPALPPSGGAVPTAAYAPPAPRDALLSAPPPPTPPP